MVSSLLMHVMQPRQNRGDVAGSVLLFSKLYQYAFWDSQENYCPTGQFGQQPAEQTE